MRLGNCLLIPAFAALLLCDNQYTALPLIAIVGLVTNIPFAVLIKLGQDYLPSRPGTAAGVTLAAIALAFNLKRPTHVTEHAARTAGVEHARAVDRADDPF